MNTKDYISLLNKPYSLNERQTQELENILSEFPYLQSARAIHLKGLYNQDSFRYNTEVKKTAAFTADRSVLFDFITSENFQSIDKIHFEKTEKAITELPVTKSEEVKPEVNKLEEAIKRTVEEANNNSTTTATPQEKIAAPKNEGSDQVIEKLEIGKPISFTKNETHSFSEWLQLAQLKPIVREENPTETEKESGLDTKLDIIDRFIESNPKITPVKNTTSSPVSTSNNDSSNSSLMTETLARVYLEQKKYTKAIQAYEILILKYPEKSVFFANRIADIKILQQNNN
ncbi:hypothetical protein DVK85_03040 [Flavobacterium arcticum]|uniref:Tetratricopeptide repeat protein n=1 Tax=Flavobacterium arcticum TaxID=1784713 RepID=A0A345H9J5_9FLAO|nr:tetratricopeptide repeat protein [Flavobacterium arcticum]AXG73255.1 hypothetical protein DVK85_03040 [Flavobacterium arcticum]KAF2513050.1 hypothetical protein E0W72_01110 [Flavobacterium arcticum]